MSRKVTGVIYQTPDGGSKQGYIIDGKTYEDVYGTKRIEQGSTVPTAGGTYTLTSSGGVKTPGSIADDLERAYGTQAQYIKNASVQKQKAINTATSENLAKIDDQRKNVEDRYGEANRNAYTAYVNASNPYGAAAEGLAKVGLSNSGYAETSKMKIANAYQNALSDNARDRNLYMQELDSAYREAKNNGDIELANAIAEYEMLVYKHGIEAAEAIAAQQNTVYQTAIDADRKREQELWERAYALASRGYSNAQIAATLGISLQQLNEIAGRR